MDENLYIRSSAAEYLIFSSQAGENGIEVRFEDGTAWLTQNMIGKLFDVESNTYPSPPTLRKTWAIQNRI